MSSARRQRCVDSVVLRSAFVTRTGPGQPGADVPHSPICAGFRQGSALRSAFRPRSLPFRNPLRTAAGSALRAFYDPPCDLPFGPFCAPPCDHFVTIMQPCRHHHGAHTAPRRHRFATVAVRGAAPTFRRVVRSACTHCFRPPLEGGEKAARGCPGGFPGKCTA